MITEQQFTNIYNLHASKVHRLCLGYASGDNELAKEWLQETFIKVWNHRNAFKGTSSIDTWIYRISVNVCLGDLRKSKNSSKSMKVYCLMIMMTTPIMMKIKFKKCIIVLTNSTSKTER